MADSLNPRRDASEAAAFAELNTLLNKAYLSGDGPEVERVMALIATAERRQPQRRQSEQRGSTERAA